jgi:hypothetical protein
LLRAVHDVLRRSLSGKNEYALTCGVTGSKIVMVASEPITKSCTDWVKVPHNSALVVTREKGDFVNVIRSPLKPQGVHPVQVHSFPSTLLDLHSTN